jgi:hypothetical protein
MAKIPGIKVSMGGEEWEIPPLSFAAVKQFSQDGTFDRVDAAIKGSEDFPASDKMDAIITVVHAALSRNDANVTLAQVANAIDQNSAPAAILAVRGATFKPRKEDGKGEQ